MECRDTPGAQAPNGVPAAKKTPDRSPQTQQGHPGEVATNGNQQISFHRDEDAPIVPGEVDTYTVDPNEVMNNQNGVTLKIDSKGDGTIDTVEQFAGSMDTIASETISRTPYHDLPATKPVTISIHPQPPIVYFPTSTSGFMLNSSDTVTTTPWSLK